MAISTKKQIISDEENNEVLESEEKKIDQIKKTYLLMDKYWATLSKNLDKNIGAFSRFVATYRNSFMKCFLTPYPVEKPTWTPACDRVLYTVTGIDQDSFVEDVLTIRGWDGYIDKFLKDKAPRILALLIARWCLIMKRDKEYEITCHYIGYSYYWQLMHLHFPKGKLNINVMRYTIEQMSYKSKLKALGNVDAWITDIVSTALESYRERLMRASDFELHYIGEKIRGKFSSAIKTLHTQYQKNADAGNKTFVSSAFVEDDVIMDNTYGSADISTLADAYASKFFEDPINEEAIKGSLIKGGISEKDLRTVILKIADDKANMNDVKRLYQSLFIIFLSNNKYKSKDIGTMRFYYEMNRVYKPGNTNDPNKIFIKDILDKWLRIGNATFRNTTRTATITTFRKSIYDYFIIKIMKDK